MARPSKYTIELAERIVKKISEGIPLVQICKEEDMPSRSTIQKWKKEIAEFSDKSARACEDFADATDWKRHQLALELLAKIKEFAEKGQDIPRGFVEGYKTVLQELARTAALHCPAKYGHKVSLGGDKDNPLQMSVNVPEGATAIYEKIREAYKE